MDEVNELIDQALAIAIPEETDQEEPAAPSPPARGLKKRQSLLAALRERIIKILPQ